MEPVSQGLVVYGPLGLWALAATLGVIALYREIRGLHKAHAEALIERDDAHTKEIKELALAMAAKVEGIGTAHATAMRERDAAMRERDERIDRQQSELAQRIIGVVTTVTDKLSAFSDAITRRSPR